MPRPPPHYIGASLLGAHATKGGLPGPVGLVRGSTTHKFPFDVGWQFAPYVARAEATSFPEVGVPVGAVGAGSAVRLTAFDALEPVTHLRIRRLGGGALLVPHRHEQAPDEDQDAAEPMSVEPSQFREQLPLTLHRPAPFRHSPSCAFAEDKPAGDLGPRFLRGDRLGGRRGRRGFGEEQRRSVAAVLDPPSARRDQSVGAGTAEGLEVRRDGAVRWIFEQRDALPVVVGEHHGAITSTRRLTTKRHPAEVRGRAYRGGGLVDRSGPLADPHRPSQAVKQ